jgi:molybdate transport system ATP-binding protein
LTPPTSFLSLERATFRLGEALVFENTSWLFQSDQHWAVLGPNGSGKSLFADALRGKLPLVGGTLRYHFRPPPGLSPEEAIGHVSFEDRKSELHDTVVQSRWNSFEEEAALLVRNFLSYDKVMEVNPFEVTERHERARPGFERRRRSAVVKLRLAPLLERRLISLSNGERQRVQLARALCHPLRLLILDEPFAGLDAANRRHFRHVLEELMQGRLRVLLLTTRADDLPQHITHLLGLDGCRVIAAESREQIVGRESCGDGQVCSPSSSSSFSSSICFGATAAPRTRTRTRRRMTEGPLVDLCHVTVRYGEATILRDVNWTIRPGESWALLGPNGSGKTTLLSLILGDNPQAYMNNVVVFGRQRGSGESVWELKRHLGWVSPELHFHFQASATCFEVVLSGFHDTIGLFTATTRHERSAARRWLERFQLLEFGNTPLFALSAGLQRMVLLARALVKAPRLLLLDEPCQGLDAAHRALFIRTVDELIRTGCATAIYVTHRPDEIPSAIHRVLRLSAGRARSERIRPNRTRACRR